MEPILPKQWDLCSYSDESRISCDQFYGDITYLYNF